MKNTFTHVVVYLFLIFPSFLFAQNYGKCQGEVIEANTKKSLEYATISIHSTKNDSLITGNISNSKGIFKIDVPYGDYYAQIKYIGYNSLVTQLFSLSEKDRKIDLGKIELTPNTQTLKEVEVLTSKGDVQLTLDKKVFNVSNDILSSGGNAVDVLENVPSVAIDVNGKVTLRGSGGVQILVDGKPSSLVGEGTAESLRRLPANLIEQVEVITNPSAKYQAEGTGGIINIVLKKERKIGVNGSFDVTLGYPDIYSISGNINVRKDKVNFFTNIGLDYQKNNGGGGFIRTLKEDTLKILDLDREHSIGGLWGNVRLGADYFLNDNNTITTSVYYQTGQDNDQVINTYQNFLGNLDNPIDNLIREDSTVKTEDKLEYAITFSHNFGKKGHKIIADIRYQDIEGIDSSLLVEKYFNNNFSPSTAKNLQQRSGNLEGEKRVVSKIDYTHQISANKKVEFGYLGSIRKIKNDFLVEEFNDVDWVKVEAVSNDFKYDENIFGLYGIYKNRIKNFSYNLGGRLEYTDVETIFLETNKTNPRSYFNFFPSVSLKYDLSKSNSFKLSYSRRIRRPTFNNLNPFFTYNDPRNQYQGNPDLNPELSNSFEIGHLKYWEKASLSSTVFYKKRNNVISRILEQTNGDTTLLRSENLNSREDLGLDLAFTYNPTAWWNVNANGSFFHIKNDATNINLLYKSEGFAWQGGISSRFSIKKNTKLQIKINHRAPKNNAQGKSFELTFVDIGLSRQFWNKKGRLSLSISDLFNSRVSRSEQDSPSVFQESEFRWRYRTTKLSFSYRFGGKG